MKKIIIALTLSLIFSSFSATGQAAFLPEDDILFTKFKDLSNSFFEAVKKRDSVGMWNSLAEEFTLTSSESNGGIMRKSTYVGGSLRPDILKVISFNLYDFRIRVYDDMAIVQSRIDWKSEYQGQPWNADFLNTDIFIFREERWQVVHRHSSYPADYLEEVVRMRKR
ncbi:MAG: nuclear transport factor 2 family protein [Cyclobacteriaceae bacterium]